MSARVWHKGPPPHVGWWNASINRYEDLWCWWDGRCWSLSVSENSYEEHAASVAEIPNWGGYEVEWTYYWPEGARVPRINPNKGKNK